MPSLRCFHPVGRTEGIRIRLALLIMYLFLSCITIPFDSDNKYFPSRVFDFRLQSSEEEIKSRLLQPLQI